MSILWCGGELEDFFNSSGVNIVDVTGYRRTNFSRCSLGIGSTCFLLSHPVTPFTSAWLSFYAYTGISQPSTQIGIGLRNSNSGEWIGIGGGSIAYRMGLYKWIGTGAAVKLTEESGTSYSYGLKKMDIQVSNYGSNGTVNVWVNGILVINYTGNLVASIETELDQIYILATGTYFSNINYSEIILADEDTRGMSLKTLTPDAAGDTNNWNNDYTNINELGFGLYNNVDGIYTESAEQDFQCNLTGMPPEGDFDVVAVNGSAYVSDNSGSLDIQLGMKTNGSINLGSTESLDSSKKSINKLWHTNPITSNAFTPSEIDSLQGMLRSK